MAKLTIEEAKVKLAPIEKAIEGLKSMSLEVPASLTVEYDRLVKIISGNANVNVANVFNEKIAVGINSKEKFAEMLAGMIGSSCKLKVVVKTDEAGKKSISFEASSGTGGGGKSGATTGGGTKTATQYNRYAVTVLETNLNNADYAVKSETFETAAKTVEFILNGGKNPLNHGAEYGKGNSMVRVLDGISKHEAFAASFTLDRSYVQVEKKAPVEPTAPAAEPVTAPAAEPVTA